MFQKRIDYILKNSLDEVNPDLKSKSSLLQLYFFDLLIVQYTLHTLYTTQKTQNIVSKTYNLLCIVIFED